MMMDSSMAFIVSQTDFSVIAAAEVLDSNLHLEPYGKQTSNALLNMWQDITAPALMVIGAHAWVISGCTPSQINNTTSFTMLPLYMLFDRDVKYSNYASNTVYYLSIAFSRYFKTGADALFNYSWLSITFDVPDSNPVTVLPSPDDYGYFNFKSYLDRVSPYTVVDYTLTAGGITLKISERSTYSRSKLRIYNADAGGEIMISATFKRDLISKVTHYDPDTDTATDYYLLADGSITTDRTDANRVRGRWILYVASNANSGLIAAQFARSEFSHSLVFTTDQEEPLYYDPCKVRLKNGSLIDSRVTAIIQQTGTNRLTIKAGTAAATLKEIIQEVYHP